MMQFAYSPVGYYVFLVYGSVAGCDSTKTASVLVNG